MRVCVCLKIYFVHMKSRINENIYLIIIGTLLQCVAGAHTYMNMIHMINLHSTAYIWTEYTGYDCNYLCWHKIWVKLSNKHFLYKEEKQKQGLKFIPKHTVWKKSAHTHGKPQHMIDILI